MLQLLGHTKTSAPGARSAKGLLDAANKGIVYFDGLHKLPSKSIDLVIDLLKNNAYTRVGENRPRPLEAVIIASVRDNLDADFMDTLRSNFPIAVSLPDFYRRSSQEKIEMILDLVTREAYSIHKNIRLDKSVLTAFALPHYPRNESQLRSEIQSACSKAFVEPKNQDACFLTITFDHLSDFVLSAANTCPDDNHAFIRTPWHCTKTTPLSANPTATVTPWTSIRSCRCPRTSPPLMEPPDPIPPRQTPGPPS